MRRYLGFTSKVYGVISLFLMIASEIAFLGTVSFCTRFFLSFFLFPQLFLGNGKELFHRNNSGAHEGSRELRTILSRKGHGLKMIFLWKLAGYRFTLSLACYVAASCKLLFAWYSRLSLPYCLKYNSVDCMSLFLFN